MVSIIRLPAEEGFLEAVKPGDFEAAGLGKLSPAERDRLNALVEAYKNHALVAAKDTISGTKGSTEATGPVSAPSVAEVPEAKAKPSKGGPGLFAKAKVMLMPGTQVEYATIKSTIPGKFRGWGGNTVFTLSNGQVWQVANGDSYFTPPVEDVEVEIIPSKLGGYWMRFPTLSTRVRVKLLMDK